MAIIVIYFVYSTLHSAVEAKGGGVPNLWGRGLGVGEDGSHHEAQTSLFSGSVASGKSAPKGSSQGTMWC